MKKATFEKLGFIRMLLLAVMVPMLYTGCGKTGLSPTSANDTTLNRNISVANVTSASAMATAGGAWVNNSFTAQTSDFTLTFDASVSGAPTNAIVALSNGAQTAYASFANLIRFNPSGDIDAYNGSIPNYAGPSTVIPYTAGITYSFTVLVHMAAQTYDISVSSPGAASKVIGTGFQFRVADSSLNNYGAFVGTGGVGSLTVNNFTVNSATPTFTRTPTTVPPTATFTSTSVPTGITATAGGAWVNTAFAAESGDFTASFNASVSSAPTNAIVGLSNGAQTAYAEFANLVRFNSSGDIDAYNGSAYAGPAMAVPYTAGTVYGFVLTIHMAAQTYDISVSAPGMASQIIGTGFRFRTPVSSLNNYGAFVGTGGSGSLSVNNFVLGAVATPTFTNTFTITNTPTWTNTP
ncbi:MAG TPA: hypothetical protein VK791_08175, partial [bacterium]|nr:hypothetical protein [bacterium]